MRRRSSRFVASTDARSDRARGGLAFGPSSPAGRAEQRGTPARWSGAERWRDSGHRRAARNRSLARHDATGGTRGDGLVEPGRARLRASAGHREQTARGGGLLAPRRTALVVRTEGGLNRRWRSLQTGGKRATARTISRPAARSPSGTSSFRERPIRGSGRSRYRSADRRHAARSRAPVPPRSTPDRPGPARPDRPPTRHGRTAGADRQCPGPYPDGQSWPEHALRQPVSGTAPSGPAARTGLHELVEERHSWRVEVELAHENNERILLSVRADPVLTPSGRILGFVLLFSDLVGSGPFRQRAIVSRPISSSVTGS